MGARMIICITTLFTMILVYANVSSAEDMTIGMIKVSQGNSFIVRDNERIICQSGDSVFQSDILETGNDGSLGLTLKDNTRLSLGPNSRMTLDEFVFNPKEEEYSFITRMVRGTLVYLSGLMGKFSPDSVSITTPTATVGIRGTRMVIRILDEDESQQTSEN